MSIVRAATREQYTVISQATLDDMTISLEARGLLTYLLARPDTWSANVTHLMSITGCGRDKMRRILSELEAAGYVKKFQSRDAGNQFSRNDYTVFERPMTGVQKTATDRIDTPSTENPSTGKPSTGTPSTGNLALTITESLTITDSNQKTCPKPKKKGLGYTVKQVQELYNEHLGSQWYATGSRILSSKTERQIKKAGANWVEDLEDWEAYFELQRSNPWVNGDNDKRGDWKPDIEYITREQTISKALDKLEDRRNG